MVISRWSALGVLESADPTRPGPSTGRPSVPSTAVWWLSLAVSAGFGATVMPMGDHGHGGYLNNPDSLEALAGLAAGVAP